MERWMLFIFFVVYFAATFAWRSWRVWQQTGLNPYVLPAGDDAQGYVAKAFRWVLLTMGGYALIQAAWEDVDVLSGTLTWLQTPAFHAIGWALLLMSLLWVSIAQIQMGASWRIGIDLKNRTALVHAGLFAASRNPIFLAMRASLLGLLLVRPNGLTLALAVAGNLLMQLQVRQEETFLLQRHGADYADYCARTRSWL